jgi:hypothetical protein
MMFVDGTWNFKVSFSSVEDRRVCSDVSADSLGHEKVEVSLGIVKGKYHSDPVLRKERLKETINSSTVLRIEHLQSEI